MTFLGTLGKLMQRADHIREKNPAEKEYLDLVADTVEELWEDDGGSCGEHCC